MGERNSVMDDFFKERRLDVLRLVFSGNRRGSN